MRFVIGTLVILFGALLVIKTDWFYSMTGAMEWPEKHIGTGGTRLFLKLIGIGIIFIALLYMTGSLGGAGRAIFTPTIPSG